MNVSKPTTYTTSEICQHVDGELVGSPDLRIGGVDSVDRAGAAQITLIGSTEYARAWPSCSAGAALVKRDIDLEPGEGRTLIRVENPDLAMAAVLELFAPPLPTPAPGVDPTATVATDAVLGDSVAIGAGSVIGRRVSIGAGSIVHPNVTILDDSTIGAGCTLWPGVVIRERCEIGDDCILHPNVVIGSDGFGYRPAPDGMSLVKIPHIGTVRLGRAVELGSGTCIDRGKFSQTVIGDGTKIDNLCQIGHNCRIGRCVIIAGMTALGGSVVVEDGAQIGGHAVIKEHCKVGAGAQLAGAAGLMRDIPPGEQWFGIPARNAATAFRELAALRKLPDALRNKTLRADDG